jgi:glycosyltransferase involved in cell wall biosynthesis
MHNELCLFIIFYLLYIDMTTENRFCFVPMVKNESHVIKRCIDSVANIATSYLIGDTGSTDGTPGIIEAYTKEKGIPGEVLHKSWVNYCYNRSYIMDQAYTHGKARGAKYLIWHDADEVFLTDPNNLTSYPTKEDANNLYNWLEAQPESMTYIQTVYGNIRYPRWNIVRNNQLYKWLSPKHEYITGTIDNSVCRYHGFILLARQEGNASRDPDRCKKDAKLFLDYFDDNGGPEKCPREVFYLAQESESFDKGQSMKYYLLRTTLDNGYWQEKYISFLRLGRMAEKEEDKVKYWSGGFSLHPNRLECIFELMHYYKDKDWTASLKFGVVGPEIRKINEDDLFVEAGIYEWEYDLDFSLAAFYSHRFQLASDINQRNMMRNKNKKIYTRLLENQKFIEIEMEKRGLVKLRQLTLANTPSIYVLDDFYTNPGKNRTTALLENFNVSGNYAGARTKSLPEIEIKRYFEYILGKKITNWSDIYNGAYQLTNKVNMPWIQRGVTDYAAIIYLTPDMSTRCGTTLYKHKATGKCQITDLGDEEIFNKDTHNDDAWEITDMISNKYNRCVIFNGKCSHKHTLNFGENKMNSGLSHMYYFDVEK